MLPFLYFLQTRSSVCYFPCETLETYSSAWYFSCETLEMRCNHFKILRETIPSKVNSSVYTVELRGPISSCMKCCQHSLPTIKTLSLRKQKLHHSWSVLQKAG